MRFLTEVPPLPVNFTGRSGLSDAIHAVVVHSLETSGTVCVHGAGGMGKTVATCAYLKETTAQLAELFPDGIIFVTVGQTPHIISLQSCILKALEFTKPLVDTSDGNARILETLAGKRCLLVLDDVWERTHLDMLISLHARPKGWSAVAVLITTRFKNLAPVHSGHEMLLLGELSDIEASALLDMPLADGKLEKVLKLCARSPLALSILGASKKSGKMGSDWTEVINTLASMCAREENPVKRCIALSVTHLPEKTRIAYLKFAVFPDDVLLPVRALQNIFGDEFTSALPELALHHLVRVEGGIAAENIQARVRLHDLSLEYVKEQALLERGEKEHHAQLLHAYTRALDGEGNWATGPNDGYFFQHLLHHMHMAGMIEEARRLVLTWDWLWAKTRHTKDIVAVIGDVRAAAPHAWSQHESKGGKVVPQGSASNAVKANKGVAGAKSKSKPNAKPAANNRAVHGVDQDPNLGQHAGRIARRVPELQVWETLLEVLTLSAHVVAEDERQLPFQVHGRLVGLEGKASQEQSIVALRSGARKELERGSGSGRDAQWSVSLRVDSADTLQGVGGPLRRTLQLHQDWVRSLAVSEDGSTLVSGSSDLTVKVWDISQDYRLRWNFDEHSKAVIAVAIREGMYAASGDEDTAILWDLSSGALMYRVNDLQGEMMAVCFVGGDHFAAAVGKKVRLLKIPGQSSRNTAASHIEADVAECNHGDKVAGIASSRGQTAQESYLACGCWDKQVVLWRLLQKKGSSKLEVHRVAQLLGGEQDVWAVALTPDGTSLACGSHDNTMHLWSVSSRDPPKLQVAATPHSDWVHSICISADGSLIATGSDDNTIALYSLALKQVVGRATIFSGAFAVALSPDASLLYSASGDIRVWSTGKLIETLKKANEAKSARHSTAATGLAVSADGATAVSVAAELNVEGKCANIEVKMWSCKTGSVAASIVLPGSADDDDRPTCVCLHPNATHAAIAADTGKVWVLPVASASGIVKPTWVIDAAHEDRILCCQWLDEDRFVTGGEDGHVRSWNWRTQTSLTSAKIHKNAVKCMQCARSGQKVLTGSDYEPARWSHLSGEEICELKDARGAETRVQTACSVSVSWDDKRAVTCSWDKVLRVWALDSGALLLAIQEVSEWVVKGFGATLAGAAWGLCMSYTWDRSIQLWDLTDFLTGPSERMESAVRQPVIVDASSWQCRCKLATLQCDASLVAMSTTQSWPKLPTSAAVDENSDARRSVVFSDEDGRVHFFEVIGLRSLPG